MRCCVVFCFMFICFEFGLVDCLKASEKGVCVSKHSVVKTRPKTVVVALSKWCGKKKCTVKKSRQQKYTVVTNSFMCCKGFVYISEKDVCEPVCSTGCINGTCTDPDVCHCAAPLYLDPTTKNKCLPPTCDHPCVSGFCTVNNTCTCEKDFVYYNATHCAPSCTDGFELNSSLSCVPKCENCTNGKCIAPGTCECDPGYKLNVTCQPQCESCINGRCTAPDTCECFEGYTHNGTCLPRCDACDNGVCVSPNVCECNSGYVNVNGTCQPVCKEPCVNGWCSAPDVCSCDEGARRKNATVCQRSCSGECRANGTCLVISSVTKTREVPYEAIVNCTDGKLMCKKMMTKSENYVDEETVEMCCDDYEFKKIDGTEMCIPECDEECEGGTCVAPNVCRCEPPLVLDTTIVPNKCVPPVCDNPCVNGVCTANNQCTCSDGFALKGDHYTCVAQCANCTNGECIRPSVCDCHVGYSMESGRCTPQCNDCSHGFCSAPNICTCDVGYKFKNNKCEPVCDEKCVNATCVSPNTCECFEGFETENGHKEICVPKCELCKKGVCTAPNKCECHKGYALWDKDCVPTCVEPCIHGYCSSPNECSCEDGYIQDEMNSKVCRKPCSLCIAGSCNLEGECICQPEMELINGTCTLLTPDEPLGITRSTTGLASLQMTWWVGGAVGLLMMVLVLVAISRIWHTRKDTDQKAPDNDQFGSLAYTLPNTLMRGHELSEADEESSDVLLTKETNIV